MGLERRGGSEQTSSVQTHVPHDAPVAVHSASHRPAAWLHRSECRTQPRRRAVPQAGRDAAAGTVALGGPRLRLPGAARPAVRHCGLEPQWSCVPPGQPQCRTQQKCFNHRSINYSAALNINFLHSNPVPGESPAFLAAVQRETNFPPSARSPTPPLLILLPQTMPK